MKSEQNVARAYYMTSAKWAGVVLEQRRIKLSRFYESNDPFELGLIDSRDSMARRVAKMLEEYHNKNTGMVCFGLTKDNPAMWAHYADKHQGVCLGFDIESTQLSEVHYTDAKIKVDLGPHLTTHALSAELISKVLLTKALCWKYEGERRALAKLSVADPKTGLYYLDFGQQIALREVLIGHRCAWTTADAATLVGDPARPVRICKVRPAFGRFAMVEQQLVPAITVRPKKDRKPK